MSYSMSRHCVKQAIYCDILDERGNALNLFPGRNGSQDCTVWDPTPAGGISPYSRLHGQLMAGQLFHLFNSQSLCCFPRHRVSGLGHSSLHRGSALSASYSGACVQTEGECPVEQTYVCTNKHTLTSPGRFHESDINLSHVVPHSVWPDSYFLSLRWIECISHSRNHIQLVSVVFRSVSIHSQWPISRFLSPRCTGAGEDGQVSFPTLYRAADLIHQLHSCALE